MSKFKEIFRFNIDREKEVEVSVNNEDGSKTIKKELQKVPFAIILKKPSRIEWEDATLEHDIYLSNLIRKGVISRAILDKTLGNEGGALSNPETERFGAAYKNLVEIQEAYQKIVTNVEKTDEDNAEIERLTKEFALAQRAIQELEQIQRNIYSCTAEEKAKTHYVIYLTSMFLYVSENDGEPKNLFKSKDFNGKLDEYDSYLDDPDSDIAKFYSEAFNKGTLYFGLYIQGNVDIKDFSAIEGNLSGTTE